MLAVVTRCVLFITDVSYYMYFRAKVQILRKGVDMKARIKTILHFIAIMKVVCLYSVCLDTHTHIHTHTHTHTHTMYTKSL